MDLEPTPDLTGASTPVAEAVARIAAEIDRLQGAPLLHHSDTRARDAVAAIVQLRARLDAAYLHLLADLDARPDAVPGAASGKTGATFLVHALNVTPQRAAHDVRAARALDPDRAGITADSAVQADATRPDGLPHLGSALAAGEISLDHVDAVLACLRRIPERFLHAVTDAGGSPDLEQRPDHHQDTDAAEPNRCMSGTARVDAFLADQARRFSPYQLRRIGRQLAATIDPQGQDDYDPKALDRRRLDYGTDATGMLVGSFALDPVAGARFRAVIEALTKAQAVGPDAVGHIGPTHGDAEEAEASAVPLRDERTASQRRADALHQLCRDVMPGDLPDDASAEQPTDQPGDQPDVAHHQGDAHNPTADSEPRSSRSTALPATRPSRGSTQVVVVATPAQLAAALAILPARDVNGPRPPGPIGPGLAVDVGDGPLDPGTLSALLCSAVFSGIVLDDPPSRRPPDAATTPPGTGEEPLFGGAVLALGRTRRLASTAQLRAVIARDRGCIVPGCTLPPSRCDAHHVVWWRHGGPTDVDNLALLCARHHSAVHAGHWRIDMIDGLPWIVAPRWVDPGQIPRRNTLPDADHAARALGQQLRGREAA